MLFQQMQEAIKTELNMVWAGVREIGDVVIKVEVLTQIVDVYKTIPLCVQKFDLHMDFKL